MCFIAFGYFGIAQFSSFISHKINTDYIKGNIYSSFTNYNQGSVSVSITTPDNNEVFIDADSGDFYFDFPIHYDVGDDGGNEIIGIGAVFTGIPSYITTAEIQPANVCTPYCTKYVNSQDHNVAVDVTSYSLHTGDSGNFSVRFLVPEDDIISQDNMVVDSIKIITDEIEDNIYTENINDTITIYSAPAPNTPTGLNASNITHESFNLGWNAVSGATYYKVWLDDNSHETINTTTFNFTGLDPSHTYIAYVEAFNEYDVSNDIPASLNVSTTAAFSIRGIVLSGEGVSNTEFYGRQDNNITATVSTSGDVTNLEYNYDWYCTGAGNDPGNCPGGGHIYIPSDEAYTTSNNDTLTVEYNSWESTDWTLTVSVREVGTTTAIEEITHFSLIDSPPIITLDEVQTDIVLPNGISQATNLEDLFYIEEGKTSTIKLNVQDDDSVTIGSATQPFADTNIVNATINGGGNIVEIKITNPSNGDVTINQNGEIINSLDPKVVSIDINEVDVSLNIHVINANDNPYFTDTNDIVYTVGGTTQTKFLQGDDIDVGDTLTFSIEGANPLSSLGFNIVNSSTGELGFGVNHPSYGDAGTYDITFKIEDFYGGYATSNITVVIDETNRSPEINWGHPTTFTANEDEVIDIDLSSQASDPDQDILTWSITGNSNLNTLATYTVVDNHAIFTPIDNKNGGPVIAILVVRDDSSASDTQQISLTWNAVNDGPVITATTKEAFRAALENRSMSFAKNEGVDIVFDFKTTFNQNVGLDTIFTDVDTGDSFHWEISEVSSNILGTISESGTDESLWYITPEDYTYGTMTVLATIYDNAGSSDSEEIDLEWNPVNDRPYWATYPGKDGNSNNIANVGCEWLYNLSEAALDPDNINPNDANYADVDFEIDTTGNEPTEMNYVTINGSKFLRWTPASTGTYNNVKLNAIDGIDDTIIIPQSFTAIANPNNGECSVISVNHVNVPAIDKVEIVFNRDLDMSYEANTNNATYLIKEFLDSSNILGVTGVSIINTSTIQLTTEDQTPEKAYSLKINDVKALDGTITGEITKGFSGYQGSVSSSLEITGITATSNDSVDVVMNMAIDSETVAISDFAINSSSGALGVAGVDFSTDKKTITLGTVAQSYATYTLIVRNISSLDGTASVGSEGISGTFTGIPAGEAIIGDCNGDYNVAFNDALMILGYIVGNYTEYSDTILENCNLNTDALPDTININDAIKVYEVFIGG